MPPDDRAVGVESGQSRTSQVGSVSRGLEVTWATALTVAVLFKLGLLIEQSVSGNEDFRS